MHQDEFYTMPLDEENVADLLMHVAKTVTRYTPSREGNVLYGIVSEADGGIIAYAIGDEHAQQIVAALQRWFLVAA